MKPQNIHTFSMFSGQLVGLVQFPFNQWLLCVLYSLSGSTEQLWIASSVSKEFAWPTYTWGVGGGLQVNSLLVAAYFLLTSCELVDKKKLLVQLTFLMIIAVWCPFHFNGTIALNTLFLLSTFKHASSILHWYYVSNLWPLLSFLLFYVINIIITLIKKHILKKKKLDMFI